VKPKEPTAATRRNGQNGTKLWLVIALRQSLGGATPATETESLPEQAPPGQKQIELGLKANGNDDATASAMDRSRGASAEDVGQEEK